MSPLTSESRIVNSLRAVFLAIPFSFVVLLIIPVKSVSAQCPVGVTYNGAEAPNSTLKLQMPFLAGESWTVGGAGSFYGNNLHCNPNNDHYATDWNRSNDLNAAVLSVADGYVSDIPNPCLGTGYGCYVRIDHADGYRTLYAHLSAICEPSVHP